jgi:hypothetical protein
MGENRKTTLLVFRSARNSAIGEILALPFFSARGESECHTVMQQGADAEAAAMEMDRRIERVFRVPAGPFRFSKMDSATFNALRNSTYDFILVPYNNTTGNGYGQWHLLARKLRARQVILADCAAKLPGAEREIRILPHGSLPMHLASRRVSGIIERLFFVFYDSALIAALSAKIVFRKSSGTRKSAS